MKTKKELMKLVSQELTPILAKHGYHRHSVEMFLKSEETLEKRIYFTLSRYSNGSYHLQHYLWCLIPEHSRLAGVRSLWCARLCSHFKRLSGGQVVGWHCDVFELVEQPLIRLRPNTAQQHHP